MEVLEIFPEPLYKGKITFSDEELSSLASIRASGEYSNTYGNTTSNDSAVLDRVDSLREKVQQHLNTYLDKVMGASGVSLVITQSWMNFNEYNTSHHTHIHVNSIVSGVIYLSPNPSPFMVFRKQDNYPLRPLISKMTPYNSPMRSIDVEQGDIILFPSQTPHGVNVNNTRETRISLAFNTFYKGVLGSKKNLTHLEIL